MATSSPCCLCESISQHIRHSRRLAFTIECPKCGSYGVTREATYSFKSMDPSRLLMIAAVVREADIHNRPIMITGGKVDSEIEGFAECVRITELLSRFPDSVSGRLEHALLNLAHISDSPGQWIAVDFTAADPRVFSLNMNESRFIVTSLAQMQLVTIAKQGNTSAELFVSAAGWNRINELEKGQSLRSRSQGFVAMWFGDDKVCDAFGGRTSEDFLFDAYRNGFSEQGLALAQCASISKTSLAILLRK